jgi:hypothetical protein
VSAVRRTQDKVEARRQEALRLGVGSTLLQRCEVEQIVTGLMTATVTELSVRNMIYVGATKFTVGGLGFNKEVVRWAAVAPYTPRAMEAPHSCVKGLDVANCWRRSDSPSKCCIRTCCIAACVRLRQVETAIHVALKDCPNRLWSYTGSGSCRNRPEQIQEQLEQAWLGSVFVAYAPLFLKHNFEFAPSLPLFKPKPTS